MIRKRKEERKIITIHRNFGVCVCVWLESEKNTSEAYVPKTFNFFIFYIFYNMMVKI